MRPDRVASVLKGRVQVRTLDGVCPSALPRQERLPLALVSLTVLRSRLTRPCHRRPPPVPAVLPEHHNVECRIAVLRPGPWSMAASHVAVSPDTPAQKR